MIFRVDLFMQGPTTLKLTIISCGSLLLGVLYVLDMFYPISNLPIYLLKDWLGISSITCVPTLKSSRHCFTQAVVKEERNHDASLSFTNYNVFHVKFYLGGKMS